MTSSAARITAPLVEDLPGHAQHQHGQDPMKTSAELPGELTRPEGRPRSRAAAGAGDRHRPAAPRSQDSPHRGVGGSDRGHIWVRPAAVRLLSQRMGQPGRDDLAAGAARRHHGRRQHGLVLVHDLCGATGATAAPSGGSQPQLERGSERLAGRRRPRHGGQLGNAVQLGRQHRGLRALHTGVRNVECPGPPGPAGPRPADHADRHPARRHPDRRRRRGPGGARRRGGRAGPACAQRVLRTPRGRRAAARARDRVPAGAPATAL